MQNKLLVNAPLGSTSITVKRRKNDRIHPIPRKTSALNEQEIKIILDLVQLIIKYKQSNLVQVKGLDTLLIFLRCNTVIPDIVGIKIVDAVRTTIECTSDFEVAWRVCAVIREMVKTTSFSVLVERDLQNLLLVLLKKTDDISMKQQAIFLLDSLLRVSFVPGTPLTTDYFEKLKNKDHSGHYNDLFDETQFFFQKHRDLIVPLTLKRFQCAFSYLRKIEPETTPKNHNVSSRYRGPRIKPMYGKVDSLFVCNGAGLV